MTTIKQADREAATKAGEEALRNVRSLKEYDHTAMVRHFARHREAAMIEGARLALEAAIREVRMREGATQKTESPTQWQRRLMHEAICSLDPAQIIKEAGDDMATD